MKKRKSKIGCYVRVSTNKTKRKDTDRIQTTKSQRHSIREWAKSNHIKEGEIRWYEDKKSGKSLDRPGLKRLLRAIDRGDIDTVVVYDLSRLARNLIEGLATLADLAKKVRVVSVSESIDFGNSSGQLIAAILLAVAQFQREETVRKIRDGIEARRQLGLRIGRPRDEAKYATILKYRKQNWTLQDIADKLGCSRQNIHAVVKKAVG